MRLLDTHTGQFVEKDPEEKGEDGKPKTIYAILSHTWDTEKAEQTYIELKEIQKRYPAEAQPPKPESRSSGPTSSMSSPPGSFQYPPDSQATTIPSLILSRLFTPWFIYMIPWLTCTVILQPLWKTFHPSGSIWDDRKLSHKIRDACWIACNHGFRYIWIDSCCIDKSSSSELSEAINSMYKWYRLAHVCYAYLADVPPGDDHHAEGSRFRKSRWFTRGWTLQELIAPADVVFLTKDWSPIGSKYALVNLVESITKIHYTALLKLKHLDKFSIAQRLSWAANRKTTRKEDRAYSLLGIFDINMPTLYGEGDRAFRRLQEQIMQRIPDQSLFAWGDIYLPNFQAPQGPTSNKKITLETVTWSNPQTPSAESPDSFAHSRNVRHAQLRLPGSHAHKIDYTFTPYGICTTFQMIRLTRDLLSQILTPSEVQVELRIRGDLDSLWYLAILGCEHTQHPGHLLGRVCYIPASQSGVELAYTGYIIFPSEARYTENPPDLFPLSPETIERYRLHIEPKTVYISHAQSNHTDEDSIERPRYQPYTAIKLVLFPETRDALRSRGYSADLRDPDLDHCPTTYWLTLSKAEHTVAVKFQPTLKKGGYRFTMDAEVKLSGSGVQLDSPQSAPDSDQADRHTVSWDAGRGITGWRHTELPIQKNVRLSTAGVGVLTVDLRLRFLGAGVYSVEIDVRSDAPPPAPPDMPVVRSTPPAPSAIESATERAALQEIGDGSPSGVRVANTEDETG